MFRRAAVAHKAPRLLGAAVIPSSSAEKVFAVLALSLSVGLVSVLIFGTYERRESVPG